MSDADCIEMSCGVLVGPFGPSDPEGREVSRQATLDVVEGQGFLRAFINPGHASAGIVHDGARYVSYVVDGKTWWGVAFAMVQRDHDGRWRSPNWAPPEVR